LSIQVVGHQWWWELHYPDAVPSQAITTANEIHIPVGRPVELELASRDVIHSFWAPSLHGKRDLIPGHGSRLVVQADRPGVLHGQCAEFCGLQHANMGFLVVAEPADEFEAWRAAQRRPPPAPADAVQARGPRVFLSAPCAMCHAVQGTPAGGQNGPDLSHVASRRRLAAGTVANTSESMSRWIADPHQLKPGTRMPPTALEPADLEALTAYLESLK
jgi:cytochrome c oxidase subunit 2